MISFDRINKHYLMLHSAFGAGSVFMNGNNVHPNPRFYKYYWWIYPIDSMHTTAEDIFYKPEYRLSTKEFYEQSMLLYDKKILFAYVNQQLHRLGNPIWDYDKLTKKYPGIIFAPEYDDDSDEEYQGHK